MLCEVICCSVFMVFVGLLFLDICCCNCSRVLVCWLGEILFNCVCSIGLIFDYWFVVISRSCCIWCVGMDVGDSFIYRCVVVRVCVGECVRNVIFVVCWVKWGLCVFCVSVRQVWYVGLISLCCSDIFDVSMWYMMFLVSVICGRFVCFEFSRLVCGCECLIWMVVWLFVLFFCVVWVMSGVLVVDCDDQVGRFISFFVISVVRRVVWLCGNCCGCCIVGECERV